MFFIEYIFINILLYTNTLIIKYFSEYFYTLICLIKFIVFIILNVFLEKGVRVVRSSSEILSLIRSCDDTSSKNASEAIQPTSNSIKNSVTPLLQIPQNIPKKLSKSIGPKLILKSNVLTTPQVPAILDHQEIKEISTRPLNNSKKLVSV